MRRPAVRRRERVGELGIERDLHRLAGMHHELDRHPSRAPGRVLGGDDHRVAIHAGRESRGIEGESQLGGSGTAVRAHEREPRFPDRQSCRPRQRPRPLVGDREAVAAHRGASHRGRVQQLVRPDGQRGEGRRGVGELVDLAGGEQDKEREADCDPDSPYPRPQGKGSAPSANGPQAAHDLALVASRRQVEQSLYRLNRKLVRCVTQQTVAGLQQRGAPGRLRSYRGRGDYLQWAVQDSNL